MAGLGEELPDHALDRCNTWLIKFWEEHNLHVGAQHRCTMTSHHQSWHMILGLLGPDTLGNLVSDGGGSCLLGMSCFHFLYFSNHGTKRLL